jgi:hypothetical protein
VRAALGLLAPLFAVLGACIAWRPAPVEVDAFAAFPPRVPEARPDVVLVLGVSPFLARPGPPEEGSELAEALAILRASAWFDEVSAGPGGAPGALRLEARFVEESEFEGRASVLTALGVLTLGIVPLRTATFVSLDLVVIGPDGAARGVASRAERMARLEGWLCLPLAPFRAPLGVLREVRRDLLRAALQDARRAGWL